MMYSRSNLKHSPNNTTLELQRDLAQSTPEQCVTLTHSVPSVQMYYALRSKLESCTDKWLAEFLHLNGLDSLLNSLDQMSGRGFTCFTDAILQMDCISCIRCVLNTSLGLDYFISSDVYTKKLTMVLSSGDALPKKQVFEVLSAVCVYSHIGYLRVMEGLSYVKSECDQLHRFSLVLNDLQKSETAAHKTAVMTFVNAIINCTPDVTERLRIRNEFIGLNLLDVLMFLRKEEPDENLILQLEIFHERKVSDEEGVNACQNIDYNSPQDLLDQIQARVFGTSRMVNFVNILQDLLAIETVYNENNGVIWQRVDQLIHHVVHMSGSPEPGEGLQAELQRLPDHLALALDTLWQYSPDTDHQIFPERNDCQGHTILKPDQQHSKCSMESKLIDDKARCFTSNIENNICEGHTLPKQDPQHNKCSMEPKTYDNRPRCSANTANIPTMQQCPTKLKNSNISNRSQMSEDFSYIDSSTNCYSNSGTGTLLESQSNVNNVTIVVRSKLVSPACDITYFVNNMNSTGSDLMEEFSHSSSSHNGIRMTSARQELSDEENINSSNYNSVTSKTSRYNQEKICNEMNILCDDVKARQASLELDEEGHKVVKKTNLIAKPRVPVPRKEMRPFRWISLPDEYIVERGSCVWLYPLYHDQQVEINYDNLETLFQITSPGHTDTVEEVVLLDATTRLKINLFLNRLDSGAEDLVHNLQEGNRKHLTLPMLQYLNTIIPSAEEISMLQRNTHPRLELGMAEQFVLLLAEVADHRLLLQAFLVQAEFDSHVGKFRAALEGMIRLSRLVLDSVDLRVMLQAVLMVGNFLNYNKFNGDVAGYHLTTLQRLTEVKSSSPCKNLLHYITQVVTQGRPSLMTFVKQVLSLENTTSSSMEDLKTDISKLNGKLRFVVTHLSKTDEKTRSMFQPFIESLRKDFSVLQTLTTELRELTGQLATYFCEDEDSFDLQECFKVLMAFCKDVKQCHTEMTFLNRQQQVGKRRGDMLQNKLRNKLVTLEFGKNAGASSSMMEDNKSRLLEKILGQMHAGNFHPYTQGKSEAPTPERDHDPAHALEMSCIPFDGSPPVLLRNRLGTTASDSVFFETPELVCASYGSGSENGSKKLTRTSTQELKPVRAVCTAQIEPTTTSQAGQTRPSKILSSSSPITSGPWKDGGGMPSATLHRKLFATDTGAKDADKEDAKNPSKPKPQLEIPGRKVMSHRRSRSDLLDSVCLPNKWAQYENIRGIDIGDDDPRQAPIAKPESTCNLSILNLEKRGKILTKRDIAAYQCHDDVCDIKACSKVNDPGLVRIPDSQIRSKEKKSTGFFSKLGRAVLKPRNTYSDGDQYGRTTKDPKQRKTSTMTDKENLKENGRVSSKEKLEGGGDFQRGTDGNGNRVSRFFQRGGLYRSSKMKKKQQKA